MLSGIILGPLAGFLTGAAADLINFVVKPGEMCIRDRYYNKLIFELSKPGRKAYSLPALDVDEKPLNNLIPTEFLTDKELNFPEVSEVDVIRHYTNLSNKNYGVDKGFYPLGSCTMKYNPKINLSLIHI